MNRREMITGSAAALAACAVGIPAIAETKIQEPETVRQVIDKLMEDVEAIEKIEIHKSEIWGGKNNYPLKTLLQADVFYANDKAPWYFTGDKYVSEILKQLGYHKKSRECIMKLCRHKPEARREYGPRVVYRQIGGLHDGKWMCIALSEYQKACYE